jgi:hypothetical protein
MPTDEPFKATGKLMNAAFAASWTIFDFGNPKYHGKPGVLLKLQ